MTEFFNFVNGFGFLNLCLIFWSGVGQLWKKIRIFGIFSIPFSNFEYEDDGIFQFCKRIRIPHFFLDFWVGEWTTLEKNSNFGIFPALFQNFGVKVALSSCPLFGFGFSDFFAIF